MDKGWKVFKGLMYTALLAALVVNTPVFAKSGPGASGNNGKYRYIVILDDLPLAAYDGREITIPEQGGRLARFQPTAIQFTGASKLDVNSPTSKQYLRFLDEKFEVFREDALLELNRPVQPVHRYRNALNGFSTELDPAEADILRNMPGVSQVMRDEVQFMETDSGPTWIGADKIINGSAGFPATGGQGVVVGVIDSGVNWDHPSFEDPGEGGASGWDHVNPYGSQLGLCSEAEVLCNDKLVGVYDFVEDNTGTDEVEENNNGKDNSGHGSHVASIAAGNPANITVNGVPSELAGVAPNANIVSYRVCYIGDPAISSDDGCQSSAILSAIDQAITDAVDVINYSVGSSASDPWILSSSTYAFLNARAAGIFVATSAGNSGPNAGTIGSPANAPWITAVGNATHDRVFASLLENLSGGATAPPTNLIGASLTEGIGIRKIVHAKDFGNALCGTGEPELEAECAANTGRTNPFSAGTFNGEIVVCDRGDYGRVEKGKNVMLAGAGGYILANGDQWGESIVADNHCLPAAHLGLGESDRLLTWLASGSNHQGSISGFSIFQIPESGDAISPSSSRGPNLPPAEDVMKPDVIAPGTQIVGASDEASDYRFLSGTSMASPHVTGGAALLKAVHANWTPAMIASAITMTATPEMARDFDGSIPTIHAVGAGRPQLDQAANAGLFLNETQSKFQAANPRTGGKPKNLNLPGLVDTVCRNSCSFQRTVTDLVGGASWTAAAQVFVEGVSVNVTPASFTLTNATSRQLTFNVEIDQPDAVGTWVYGEVRLTSAGRPDSVFPLAIFADGGELPAQWDINSDSVAGWQEFELSGLAAMPDATFTSGGFVEPTVTVENLPQDPDNDSPYDGATGVMTVWQKVQADALWLHTETLASTAEDLDLFVGRDTNGDGQAQESEELCSSTSPTEIELCDLFTPVAGNYWILVQNWTATNATDEVTLKSAVVGKDTESRLAVTGEGIIPAAASHKVRLSWDNVNVVPGAEMIGAVGIGTSREQANNIGIIPVTFTKTGVEAPETIVLMSGVKRGLTLAGSGTHDRSFIDVPTGASALTISATGADGTQSENLKIELYRVPFDDAFESAPFADAPDMGGAPLASASGAGGAGPVVTVTGAELNPGRWFAVLKNSRGENAAVEIQADVTFTGDSVPLRAGLWEASSRTNLRQGFDYTTTGGYRAFLWYTYDEDGAPTWYQAAAPEPDGNIWVAELLRYTNDGTLQQATPVGHVSITSLAEQDAIFSFVLFGENGSDREFPSLPPVCPTVDDVERTYNGVWSRAAVGVGGATVVVNATSQAFVHYIYDEQGNPMWLIGSPDPQSAAAEEMSLLQFGGYCAVCAQEEITIESVGSFTRVFMSEDSLTWNLNYNLNPPLSGTVDRTDDAAKLTSPVACE